MKAEKVPPRSKTIRREMIELLYREELSARDLSQMLAIREKEVAGHLEHISRTASSLGKSLQITPSTCLSCGFVFLDRKLLTKPGRCPKCRNSHIEAPLFRLY